LIKKFQNIIEKKAPVIVSWLDHSTFEDTGWADEDSLKELLGGIKIKTIGFILLEDEDSIVMVSTIGKHEKFAHEFCILKGVISGVQVLDVKDPNLV